MHQIIQLVFPNVDEELKLDQPSALGVLKRFPHPQMLKRFESLDKITKDILGLRLKGIGKIRAKALAIHLWRAGDRSIPSNRYRFTGDQTITGVN